MLRVSLSSDSPVRTEKMAGNIYNSQETQICICCMLQAHIAAMYV